MRALLICAALETGHRKQILLIRENIAPRSLLGLTGAAQNGAKQEETDMNKMKLTAMASSALLGLSLFATGGAMAGDPVQCQQQAEEDCASSCRAAAQAGPIAWNSSRRSASNTSLRRALTRPSALREGCELP
ncbi:MAG: hypothetical protein JKP95_01010 [Oceanicaulis sp.]|nr:hypothetical protein [Oceanicaulis sp.]